jgi:hypothetical protein
VCCLLQLLLRVVSVRAVAGIHCRGASHRGPNPFHHLHHQGGVLELFLSPRVLQIIFQATRRDLEGLRSSNPPTALITLPHQRLKRRDVRFPASERRSTVLCSLLCNEAVSLFTGSFAGMPAQTGHLFQQPFGLSLRDGVPPLPLLFRTTVQSATHYLAVPCSQCGN